MSLFDGLRKRETTAILQAVGIGVVAAGIGYLMYKKFSENCDKPCGSGTGGCCPASKKPVVAVVRTEQSLGESAQIRLHNLKEAHKQKFADLAKAVEARKEKHCLDYPTLTEIQKLAVDLCEKDLEPILIKNREERRKYLGVDFARYEELVIKERNDVSDLFAQNLKEVLKEFGVEEQKYKDSIAAHLKTDPSIDLEGNHLIKTLVATVPARNDQKPGTLLHAEEVHQWLLDEYKKLEFKGKDDLLYGETKERMLLDRLFEKYKLEEEDLLVMRRRFRTQESIKRFTSQLEDAMLQDVQARVALKH